MLSPRLLLLLSLLCCAISHGAEPSDPHALLRKGIALQREASWSSSIAALEKARASGVLHPAERVECAFYLAAAYVAIGSDAAARRELGAVLDAQPGFEPPPYTSPKVSSLLGEVSRERGKVPILEPRPPRRLAGDAQLGAGVELTFEARRASSPIYGVVRYRLRGDPTYTEAPLRERGKDRVLAADARPRAAGVLEYYAEALSPTGTLRAGSAEVPLELPIAELDVKKGGAAGRGPSKLVWLAIPAGVVLGAAVGVGLYFGLRSRD